MTKTERTQIKSVKDMADQLMNSKPRVNPVVRNVDIIEALIGDLRLIEWGSKPKHVAELIKTAEEAGEL